MDAERDSRDYQATVVSTTPNAPAKSVLRIKVRGGSLDGTLLEFRPGKVAIGREPGNTIRLDDSQDPLVSGKHAEAFFENGTWMIQDLKSTNGTWLNQQRLETSSPFRAGDLVELGGCGIEGSVALEIIPTQDINSLDAREVPRGGKSKDRFTHECPLCGGETNSRLADVGRKGTCLQCEQDINVPIPKIGVQKRPAGPGTPQASEKAVRIRKIKEAGSLASAKVHDLEKKLADELIHLALEFCEVEEIVDSVSIEEKPDLCDFLSKRREVLERESAIREKLNEFEGAFREEQAALELSLTASRAEVEKELKHCDECHQVADSAMTNFIGSLSGKVAILRAISSQASGLAKTFEMAPTYDAQAIAAGFRTELDELLASLVAESPDESEAAKALRDADSDFDDARQSLANAQDAVESNAQNLRSSEREWKVKQNEHLQLLQEVEEFYSKAQQEYRSVLMRFGEQLSSKSREFGLESKQIAIVSDLREELESTRVDHAELQRDLEREKKM